MSIDGERVEEQYFNGAGPSDGTNLKSASKSVLSILVGIALDQGHLENVHNLHRTLLLQIPGRDGGFSQAGDHDRGFVDHALRTQDHQQSKLWAVGTEQQLVCHVLTRPMVDKPGARMICSTGNSHLLSALLTESTGMSALDFARRYLGEPLAIRIRPWMRDPQGIYFGGNEMHLTPRDMLEIGELYLNRGRVGERQVVSEAWIRESFRPRTRSRWSGREYGYGWWIRTLAGNRVYYAWGYGGQLIFVVPALDLVAVATSSALPGQGRRSHLRAVYDLMEQDLLPAVK